MRSTARCRTARSRSSSPTRPPRARSSTARPPAITYWAIRGRLVTNYVAEHQINEGTYPSLAVLVREISDQVTQYGSLAKVPAEIVGNTRNDMYLASEALRFLMKDKEAELDQRGCCDTQQLQRLARQRHEIHSELGEDRGCHRARPWHHDRLEAHCGDGRREDRQDPSDLRAGRLRRNHGSRDHRGG